MMGTPRPLDSTSWNRGRQRRPGLNQRFHLDVEIDLLRGRCRNPDRRSLRSRAALFCPRPCCAGSGQRRLLLALRCCGRIKVLIRTALFHLSQAFGAALNPGCDHRSFLTMAPNGGIIGFRCAMREKQEEMLVSAGRPWQGWPGIDRGIPSKIFLVQDPRQQDRQRAASHCTSE
jgi:hypothetical protein